MKVEVTPRYTIFLQKPNCCASACLQMILYRRGFGIYNQEDIAVRLGTKIPGQYVSAFEVPLEIAGPGEEPWLKTVESETRIREFLSHYGLPLDAKVYRASQIENLVDFIADNIRAGNDLWVEMQLKERNKMDAIHDNVIEGIEWDDPQYAVVSTVDPEPRVIQRPKMPVNMLKRSIDSTYGRECGIVVISGK